MRVLQRIIGVSLAVLIFLGSSVPAAASTDDPFRLPDSGVESILAADDIFGTHTSQGSMVLEMDQRDNSSVDIYLGDLQNIGAINQQLNEGLAGIINNSLYTYQPNSDTMVFYGDAGLIELLDLAKQYSLTTKQFGNSQAQFVNLANMNAVNPPLAESTVTVSSRGSRDTGSVTGETVPLNYVTDGNRKISIGVDDLIWYFEIQGGIVNIEAIRVNLFMRDAAVSFDVMDKNKQIHQAEIEIQGRTRQYKEYQDLRILCDLTAEEIERGLTGALSGRAEFLLKMQDKYGVTLAFAVGAARAETSQGVAGYALTYKNLYNIRYLTGEYKDYRLFDDPVAASIEDFFSLISRSYLSEDGEYFNGYTTIGVHTLYAEDPSWSTAIESYMQAFYAAATKALI